ncbi:MAG: TonB-dependent receptor plug domain-containing protein [Novosphingobium sp.]
MKFVRKSAFTTSTCLATAALLSVGFSTAAQAQGAAPADSAEACADTNNNGTCDKDERGDIVVTGSRIRRDSFNTPDPITVVTREETTQAGFNSTSEALQSTAVTNGQSQINNSFGGFVTAGGPGANTISLRGLGATRTLVLLNGRRVAPAGSRGSVGSADLNVLPSAMIDRIEVLNGGASSIYGSDAVAGVINIVTRKRFDGLYLEGQHNIPEVGTGMSGRYSVTLGYQGDRFNFAGSLEYYNRDTMKIGDAAWARCQTSYRKLAGSPPGSGDFIDPLTGKPKCYPTGVTGESGVTVNTIGTPNLSSLTVDRALGVPSSYTGVCNRFRPDATAAGALPGYECVGGGSLSLGIRDTFPASILKNDMISPARIYTGFFQADYKLNALGDAEVYGELLLNRRKSSQLGNRQFTIDYPHLSPLIPAGLTFATPFLPPQATNPGVPVGIRVFADYGNYESRQTVDYVKALGGIRGNLPGDWRYDLSVSKSWSDADYTTDLILTSRLNQSLDVLASGSGFVCRNTANGCVAAPALTPAVIGGQFPSAWLNFVVQPVTGHTAYRETTVAGSVDGSLFNLPGGAVKVALGAEYRKASIDDTPSIESQTGNLYNFSSSSITRGSDSVWEVFGEVELPLVREVSGIHDLTVTGSLRYTDYKSYGGQTTYKLGGRYAPFKELAFRGSYGTSYRAPALYEQFLGATSGFQSGTNDPCNNLTSASNPVRIANCQTEGIGLGFNPTASIAVLQRGGAESGLHAETSKSWTAGAVVQPSFGRFGKLSFSVDYWSIKIDNGVSQLGFGTILQQCYDDPDFRAESICALVTRQPAAPFGLTVVTGFVNISKSTAKGWDFNLRYELPVGQGTMRLNADVTKMNDRYSQNLPTDPISDNIGTLNNPEWSGTFSLNYKVNRWDFRYGVDWLDAVNSPASYIGVSQAVRDTYVFETEDYFLHSASVRYRADDFSITMGVRNLFNKEPPQISSGAYNRIGNAPLYSGYDYAGRTFFINVSTKM